MDADKVAFLAGKELPGTALVKTLLVASGEQGVPPKLKEKGEARVSTCTRIYKLHNTCSSMHSYVATTTSIRMGRGEARAGPTDESGQGRQHCQHLLHPPGSSHVVITHLTSTWD